VDNVKIQKRCYYEDKILYNFYLGYDIKITNNASKNIKSPNTCALSFKTNTL